ncbi:MFS transporter [Limoniibacter endophyticus]|uniref:MFS transporter n=2 Tax=Limoniibacter endophyticus TaxID=1565040 RepID=A0A8J3DLI9_9HYPH|nr:MFS transporter [Limoniibacter endophyticus]
MSAIAPEEEETVVVEEVSSSHLPTTMLGRILLGASLVLIAFNLRPVFASASVLLPEIVRGLGLTSLEASILTTLPVVCLGLFAPFAPRLSQRIGTERTLLLVLVLLAVGTSLRGIVSFPFLLLGTAMAGGAIAVGNVLLPGLVKRDFPKQTALMTGLYTMALCAGAALAAGVTVPIENMVGGRWELALAFWALPVLLILALWLPQALAAGKRPRQDRYRVSSLWRDRLAWQLTLFMGLQSSLAYIVFGWLAPILRERGMDAVAAGAIVSLEVVVQMIASLVLPGIAMRCRDQRGVNLVLAACAAIGLLGFLFAPLWSVWLWVVVQGIGQGGMIAVAMTMIVLRSPDSHVAAHLSGMAQFIGYLIAAAGPLAVGLLHSLTGTYAASGILFALIGLGIAITGWGAGRNLHVSARSERIG